MLSREHDELLTRVGPGTPMGRLMREYWIPALLSSELPHPDCAPVRVLLLCERLVAFRDTDGRVGLVEEACPHRGASLYFARNEDGGLRCLYHGWKFDVTGACLAMPTEPASSTFKDKVRARAYPCSERGGVVWAYLGPRATPPPLPELEPNMDAGSGVDATLIECNWLQSIEGDVDLAHIPHLHAGNLRALGDVVGGDPSAGAPAPASADPPPIEVADTPAGFVFASPIASGTWQIGHFMFPFFANLPYGPLGSYWVVARVPLDDHHTMAFGMWRAGAPRAPAELMFGTGAAYLPNTRDWLGRFRLARNASNDYGLDRMRQRMGPSGIAGQATEDAAITWSMGPIVDRTKEHLGTRDIAIIHLRQRLLAAVRATDAAAPALATPGAYRVKHGDLVVDAGATWQDALRRQRGFGEP